MLQTQTAVHNIFQLHPVRNMYWTCDILTPFVST